MGVAIGTLLFRLDRVLMVVKKPECSIIEKNDTSLTGQV